MAQDDNRLIRPYQRVAIKSILANPRERMMLLEGMGKGLIEVGRDNTMPIYTFYRKDGCSGGNHRCDHCKRMWIDHYAPGSQCEKP